MQNSLPLLTFTMTATGAIAANRFVTPAGAQAGAGVNTQGVARMAAAINDKVSVDVLGTAVIEAGAAIAAGALVESDATGRAVTKTMGIAVGRLAPGESATAAGQLIEILLLPN